MATVASTSGASVMAPSNTVHSRGRATSLNSPIASEGSEDAPMTKIQWMAMMLKAKVSGPQPTEAKKPIKINQNSFEPAPKVADLATKLTAKKKSKMPEGYGCVGSNREAIQRMIAMREDPAFSPRNQPIPQSTHVNIPGRPSARKLSSSTATESVYSSSLPSSLPAQWHRPTLPSSSSSSSSFSSASSSSASSHSDFSQKQTALPPPTASSPKMSYHHQQIHPQDSESKQKDQDSGGVVPGIEQPLLTGRRRNVGPLVPSIFANGAPVRGDSFSIEHMQQKEQQKSSLSTRQHDGSTAVAPVAVASTKAEASPSIKTPTSYSPPSSAVTRGTRDSESTRRTGPTVTTTQPPLASTTTMSAADASSASSPKTAATATAPKDIHDDHNNIAQNTHTPSSIPSTPTSASTAPLSVNKKRDSVQKDVQRPPSSPRRHTLGSGRATAASSPTSTTKTPSYSFLSSPPPSPANYSSPSLGQTTSRLPPLPSPTSPSSTTSLTSSPSKASFQTNPPLMPTSTVTTTTTTTATPSSSQSATSAPLPVKSAINPTLRQLQTPHIPVNLVQARIQQNEEKKRQDEELAKIPITANLRSVKKIHAVMIDDLTPPSPSDPNSLGVDTTPSTSRPRSRTTSSAQDYMPGGKRRGDRDHIEAVAIPRSLAEKVEGILSRKMAGKGCLLDEMEKLREEEEIKAAKAATLPPIVRGQPRKRALTSSHIKNLVSSWDTKVEAANQTTLEAERSRKFLEERSHARAELPKFLGMNPLIQPPAMPAPPPSAGSESASGGGKVSTARKNAAGVSTRTRHASLSAPSSRASSPVEKTLAPPKKEEEIAMVADENKDSSRNEDACTTTNTSSDAKTEEIKDNKAGSSCPSSTPLAVIPEVERSGDVLVHKAIVSRPRRKNVRGAM